MSIDVYLKTEIKVEPDDFDEPFSISNPSVNFPSFSIKEETAHDNFDDDDDDYEDEDDDYEFVELIKKPKTKKRQPSQATQSFICPHCNIVIESKQKFSSHLKIHQEATHQCPHCDKKFKSKKNMEKHDCAICRVCGSKFNTKSELKVHMKHNHVDAAAQIYYVQCDFCGKKLKTKTYLIHHIRAEHLKDPKHHLLCTLCGGSFANKFILNQHMKIAHSSMIACKICNKMVKPLCMPYHMKQVHASERSFLCTICSAAFKTRDNLNDHVKTHDKKFLCQVCDKTFSHKYQLKQHLILHNDPNAFTCTICDRKFTTRSYLKRHMKAHEDGNVKCKICGVDVNTLSLHYHMKNAHPMERFTCEKCNAGGFLSHREFTEHLLTHEEERVRAMEIEKRRLLEEKMREDAERQSRLEIERVEKEKKVLEEQLNAKNQAFTYEKVDYEQKIAQTAQRALNYQFGNKNQDVDASYSSNYGYSYDNRATAAASQATAYGNQEYINQQSAMHPYSMNPLHPNFMGHPQTYDSSPIAHSSSQQNHESNENQDSFEEKFDVSKFEPQNDDSFDRQYSDNDDDRFDDAPQSIHPNDIKKEIEEDSDNPSDPQFNPFDMFICDYVPNIRKPRKQTFARRGPRGCRRVAKQPFVCDCCGHEVMNKANLLFHLHRHFPETFDTLQCNICGKNYPNKMCLAQHMKSHDTTLVECQICHKRVKPLCMSAHLKQVHTNYRTLKCDLCEKVFKTKQNLRDHKKSHDKNFQCEICGKNFSHKSQMNEHMMWHESPEAFQCPICFINLKDKRILKKHVLKIHEKKDCREKNFKCTLCTYSTDIKGNLQTHEKRHQKRLEKLKRNPNLLKCDICFAVLANEVCLKIHHQKVHTDDKIKCDYCEVIVKTKGSLWNHIRKKHGIEPEKTPRPKKEKKVKEKKERKGRGKGKRRRKKDLEDEEAEAAEAERVNIINIQNVFDVIDYS